VYGTLQRHGGEIAIESAVGRGTTVRLSFPTRAEAAEGARPAAEETPRRNLNLLVVDDDPMLRQSLKNVLEADSHAVSVADGGRAGIQAFLEAQTSATPFDVVITDLGMPQVGGREVARAVKAASPSTPVILLTGWGARMTAEIDIPAQVDWVLSKPPKLRELREALAAVTG
jgi:DNA-binding response OmpR family regulator